MANAAKRTIPFTDPVHGSIPVEARFMDIVNSPEFQRLGTIEQGSFRPVFAAARHDRFIHSLGTYHLAGIFVKHFFANLKEDTGIKVDAAEEELLSTTFRYAALLHDIGHAPFSHTTENLFLEKKDTRTGLPHVWVELCREIGKFASPTDHYRFAGSTTEKVGAAHEIMSALVMLRNHDRFTKNGISIDRELAVRMIIGYTYSAKDVDDSHILPAETRRRGICNCLIQMLNSSVMDVDRLDYLVRDTRMSGYVNAPLDLNALAASVTAVEENGRLMPAYRSSAISAIETMYHAKLSHDAWVLAHPAGAYDAALRQHCIRQLNHCITDPAKPDVSYTEAVFCAEALSRTGITYAGKTYRLLSDTDIAADLKAQSGFPFDEILTRALGSRRTAVWSSYYEFRYLFDVPGTVLTHKWVCSFFKPLIEYLDKKHHFEFNAAAYAAIQADAAAYADENIRRPADLLDRFLRKLQTDKKKPEEDYCVVLLSRSLNFNMKLDPASIRIVFTKKNFPRKKNTPNWTTFEKLRNLTGKPWNRDTDWHRDDYFYLFRRGGMGSSQLTSLRAALVQEKKSEKSKP